MKASEYLEQWRKVQKDDDPEGKYGIWKPGWMPVPHANEVEQIANTLYPDICFSQGQGFKGIGLVGVIGEIAMYCKPAGGAIFELGVGTSSIYLTALAKRHDRKLIHLDYDGTKMAWQCASGGHIAPDSEVFVMPSDDFFKDNTLPPVAFAFIDGGHEYAQAKRDFWNTEPYVIEDGYILLHDTYPPAPQRDDWTSSSLCWDCYKLRQDLEKDARLDCLSFHLHGQIGFTLVRKKAKNRPYYQE